MPQHVRGRTVSTPPALGWWEAGEALFTAVLDRLAEPDFDEPSLLPTWPRRTVVAHVARNADALSNLLAWARTGEETPMYASPEARDIAIADSARQPASELVADCRSAGQRLAAAVRHLPASAWTANVRTAQGRTISASEVPWMRCREVWAHAVDLDTGIGFPDIPDDVLVALIDDVFASWTRQSKVPDITFTSLNKMWGNGTLTVSGDLPDLAAWLTGRRPLIVDGRAIGLPRWL